MFALGADEERIAWGIGVARKARQDAELDPERTAFGVYLNCGCSPDIDVARGLVKSGLTTFARFSVMHGKASGPCPIATPLYCATSTPFTTCRRTRGVIPRKPPL